MSGMVGLVIEALVAVLLAITILWCMLLDRRLKRLKADTAEFRHTIAELVAATETAERAIQGLKATATRCDESLAERLGEAERLSTEIAREVASGQDVLDRITRVTLAARASGEGGALDPFASLTPTPIATPGPAARARGLADAALEAGRVAERLDAARRTGGRAA